MSRLKNLASPDWSDEERKILRDTYVPDRKGALRTQRALESVGYSRTLDAIYNRVRRERRLQQKEEARRVDRPLTPTSVHLIRSYAARGYSVQEIAEELNRLPDVIMAVLNNDYNTVLLF